MKKTDFHSKLWEWKKVSIRKIGDNMEITYFKKK